MVFQTNDTCSIHKSCNVYLKNVPIWDEPDWNHDSWQGSRYEAPRAGPPPLRTSGDPDGGARQVSIGPPSESPGQTRIRQLLRGMRATPPGLATMDEQRRATFQAAMEQSEQLLAASRATPYASRPLPLFYALSQGSRAVAAAHAEDWHVHGHGLSWEGGASPPTPLHQRISPSEGRTTSAFAGMAAAVGAPMLTGPVELGAVWSALPELLITPPPDSVGRWPRAVFVSWENHEPRELSDRLRVALIGLPDENGRPPSTDAITTALACYPRAADFELTGQGEKGLLLATLSEVGAIAYGHFPAAGQTRDDRRRRLDEVAPEYRFANFRHLLPAVGDGQDELPPVLLWWVLLFALSMYARYEPAAWTAALSVNSSELSVPLEAVLDEALNAVPHLLLDALMLDAALLRPGDLAS